MGVIEAGVVALVILFYILRAIFRGVRGLAQWVRRARGVRPAGPVEQSARPQPSQRGAPARPRPEASPRRPEAGGPAVTGAATEAQFRAQVAQIEARREAEEDARLRPASLPAEAAPASAPRLLTGPDDLLRAVILQEVLAQPLSQRRRATRPARPPQ